jgi:hypothetical protein
MHASTDEPDGLALFAAATIVVVLVAWLVGSL